MGTKLVDAYTTASSLNGYVERALDDTWGQMVCIVRGVVEGTSFFAMVSASNNIPGVSGGAIFHTGFLRVADTIFVKNQAIIEGPAVMSPGVVQLLSNVDFVQNTYHCRAGEYGYIVNDEARGLPK